MGSFLGHQAWIEVFPNKIIVGFLIFQINSKFS